MAAAVRAGLDGRGAGLIVSASRAVLYPPQAGNGAARSDAVRAAARALRGAINAVRS
jgi:hypothetical protein